MAEGRLVIRSLTGAERVVTLEPGHPMVLGRSRFCDQILDDKHVARRHLKVEFQGSQCRFESCGKDPFSYKGQNKLAALLKNGDVIRIGNHEVVFYLPNEKSGDGVEVAEVPVLSQTVGSAAITQIKLVLPRHTLIVFERVGTRVEALAAKGERSELTEGFTWDITPPGSLLVNADRELVPMRVGPARVAVRMGPWFDVAEVVVEDPALDALVLLKSGEPVSEGEEFAVQVMGLHHDDVGRRTERAVTHLCQFVSEPENSVEILEQAGSLRALRAGELTLKAICSGVESPPVRIRVEPPVLKSLSLNLATHVEAGSRVALRVEGVWSHGRREPYTEAVEWEISHPEVVGVRAGFLEGLQPGFSVIRGRTAFLESAPVEVEVRVGAFKEGGLVLPDEMAPSARCRPVARVLTAEGQTWDVTALAHFESDNPAVVRLHPDGAVEAVKEGMGTITARYMTGVFTKSVKVTRNPRKAHEGVYRELLARVLDEELPVGLSTKVQATGLLHDGSQNEVPSAELFLTALTPTLVSCRAGEVVAVSPGEAKVRVTHGTMFAELMLKIVGSRIVRIAFDPPVLNCKPDEKVVVKAFALSSDGRETEMTHLARWQVPRGIIGSPRAGSVQAVMPGAFELVCDYGGLTKSVTLTATEEEVPDEDPNRYGDLTLKGVIGVGGMGRVFRAERVEDGRPFAIKTLRNRYLSDARMVERFLHEAQTLHSFQHPHIVKVFRCGKKVERPYMVMEFLEGDTLAAVVKRKGPLPAPLAVAMIRDVARALHVLHAKKAVHRDVKPGNIFLTKDGVVKLMDFGITRVEGDESAQTGHAARLIGTASYVAPEQARASGTADPRSDLYSLGATFFALLAARPPYLGDTGLDIVLQHISAPVPNIRTLVRDTPEDVAALVSRLLAKDPAARPQSAAEVALALELMASDVDLRECFL